MRLHFPLAAAIGLASLLPLVGCGPSPDGAPTDPSRPVAAAPAAARVRTAASPQGRSVLAAMENFKQAILASDTAELARIWIEDYTFVNPQGAVVTGAQRLANIGSGNTNVQVIDNEREITVRVFGDAAVVQNLSTLRGSFSGQPTDTDLRGTFVWLHRNGRWWLVTNQLTPVVP
jgi:ketosteroid isomerase-like protein